MLDMAVEKHKMISQPRAAKNQINSSFSTRVNKVGAMMGTMTSLKTQKEDLML